MKYPFGYYFLYNSINSILCIHQALCLSGGFLITEHIAENLRIIVCYIDKSGMKLIGNFTNKSGIVPF
jgi:hypothetical protein